MAVEINNNREVLQKQLEDAIQNTIQKAIENLVEKGVLDRKRHGKTFKEIGQPVCIRQGDGTDIEGRLHHEMKMRHHFRHGHHHRHHHFYHMHHGHSGRFIHHFKGKHGKFGKFDKRDRFSFLECAARSKTNVPAIEYFPTNENSPPTKPDNQVATVDKVSKDLQKLQFNENVTIIENGWALLD